MTLPLSTTLSPTASTLMREPGSSRASASASGVRSRATVTSSSTSFCPSGPRMKALASPAPLASRLTWRAFSTVASSTSGLETSTSFMSTGSSTSMDLSRPMVRRRATGKRVPGPRTSADLWPESVGGPGVAHALGGGCRGHGSDRAARRQRDGERTPSPAATLHPPHARLSPLLAADPDFQPRRTRGCPRAHALDGDGCSHAAGVGQPPAAPAPPPACAQVANTLLTPGAVGPGTGERCRAACERGFGRLLCTTVACRRGGGHSPERGGRIVPRYVCASIRARHLAAGRCAEAYLVAAACRRHVRPRHPISAGTPHGQPQTPPTPTTGSSRSRGHCWRRCAPCASSTCRC